MMQIYAPIAKIFSLLFFREDATEDQSTQVFAQKEAAYNQRVNPKAEETERLENAAAVLQAEELSQKILLLCQKIGQRKCQKQRQLDDGFYRYSPA